MNNFEKMTSAVQIISVIFLGIGAIYGGFQISNASNQLNILIKTHQDNHDWNRRVETARFLEDRENKNGRGYIHSRLGHINRFEPIPLNEILAAFEKDPELKPTLHRFLNSYERMAAGVFMGVYDEEIIKNSMFSLMNKNIRTFSEYIAYRRRASSRQAWVEYERLVNKWDKDNLLVFQRKKTGNIQ